MAVKMTVVGIGFAFEGTHPRLFANPKANRV
jgi:hypothetical protein